MKPAALLVGSLLIMGCSGSTAQISQADSVGGGDAATTIDSATSEVGVDAATSDAHQTIGEDAGKPIVDAAAIDSGSPPIVDANGPPTADSSPPIVDASPPPPVDAGPSCTPIDDKVACEFGFFTTGAYSRGIADDGCGSYYNCSAAHCGVRVPGSQDAGAGVGPDDPWPCAAAGFTGWQYECDLGEQVKPAGCVMTGDHQVMCCPIPTNGQPFSKVIY